MKTIMTTMRVLIVHNDRYFITDKKSTTGSIDTKLETIKIIALT